MEENFQLLFHDIYFAFTIGVSFIIYFQIIELFFYLVLLIFLEFDLLRTDKLDVERRSNHEQRRFWRRRRTDIIDELTFLYSMTMYFYSVQSTNLILKKESKN